MKTKVNIARIALFVAVASHALSSVADVVVSANVGGLATFKDTNTGFTWAKIDTFYNQTITSSIQTANSAGFAIATQSQVQTLLSSLPLTSGTTWDHYASAIGYSTTLGTPLIWAAYKLNNPNSYGYYWSYRGDLVWHYVNGTAGSLSDPALGIWALFAGPNASDTLASTQGNASALRKIFSLQASYVNPGLSYDCSVFDAHGVCVAFSGRYSSTTGSGPEATSGVLTAAYRMNPNIRVGGFLEQYATDITSNGVRMNNTNPDFGVFGVWSQTETGEGFKIRAAYRYGNHGVTITRDATGSAEAGSGNSDLTTQGAQLTASKGYQLNNTLLASPYVGLRYINIKRNGYSESATAAVTTPLTYSTLQQESTSLLLGVNLAAQVASAVSITGSVGVETDTSQKISNYSASGVANLGSIQFNNDSRRTRAVASVGVAYKIAKTQQVSAQVYYREEAFGSASTATGMLTYAAGF